MKNKTVIILISVICISILSTVIVTSRYAIETYKLNNELQVIKTQNEYLLDIISSNSVQERYRDYTITDLVVLNEILVERTEATSGHFIRLDINHDGVLDVLDSAKLHRVLAGLE